MSYLTIRPVARKGYGSMAHEAKPNGLFIAQNAMTSVISIYTLSDLGVLSNLIGSLSLANEHYSPPTE